MAGRKAAADTGNDTKKMNRAFKYRLYPDKEQAVLFAKTFGCCRKVYNLMLSDKIASYKESGKFVRVTPAKYKKEYPFLKEVDSLALANKQLDLEKAFRNCFEKKRKKNNGFPKYKSAKHSRRSYTTNNQKGTVAVTEKGIRLPKAGIVRALIHREPENDWRVKSVTISQDADGKYYASVLFEYERPVCNGGTDIKKAIISTDNNNVIIRTDKISAIGLDYASDGLYTDSEGNTGSNHRYYRESHKKLAREQRRLSRKKGSKKGEQKSNNYLRQQRKVSRIHRHIANQRLDNLHKLSFGTANRYDVVCVEDLDMKAMANKGFGNGKATMDNGYGMFLAMLEYKLADRGKYLVRVGKWYPSSQICSACGRREKSVKDLRIRRWKCPGCGREHDRDVNAAKNILKEGLRLLKETA